MAIDAKKILVVLGATGAQGNPVARYALNNLSDQFWVRCVTRDPKKLVAHELALLGAEVIAADFDDEDALRSALKGANAIFAITNFWDQNSLEIENNQGKLVNKLAGQLPELEHFVFSSLLEGRNLAGGKFQNILPYNSKAYIREDLQENYPKLWAKTTEIFVAYYYQNWLKYSIVFGPQKKVDCGIGCGRNLVLGTPFSPSTHVPVASSDDVGVVVGTLLQDPSKYRGKTVVVMGDLMPEGERLKIWAEALGIKAVFKHLSAEDFQKKMEGNGIPPHSAIAATELCEALVYERPLMETARFVKAKDIIPSTYKLKKWTEYVKEENWFTIL